MRCQHVQLVRSYKTIFLRRFKLKITVENNQKPPPYTKDEYVSAAPIKGREISLDGLRMQWMCTAETEGFNRNDHKAGLWTNQTTGHNLWSLKPTEVSEIVKS